MGRKNKYETHVQPRLEEIREWIGLMSEGQLAKRLGISPRTLETYKKEHEELREAIKAGQEDLTQELKKTLKKKAQGFYYKETKTTIRKVNGATTTVLEEYERYSPPDLGAIHLLLKNLDPEWRNDDQTTVDMKRERLELDKEKAEEKIW